MINISKLQGLSIIKLRNILFVLLLLIVGAGESWAQGATTWDGTDYSNVVPKFAENKFADEGLTVDGHDGKSWENAFVITTARQLAYFAWIVKTNKTGRASNYYWKLGADIDLGGHDWTVFGGNAGGQFQGHFDGQNHTISNLKLVVTTNSHYGLLTTIQGASASSLAEVKDLNISGVTFTSAGSRANDTRWGALAGTAKQANISNVKISNVSFEFQNTITGNSRIGGAIGYMDASTSMDDVDVTGVTATFANTTTSLYLGGVVGQANGTPVNTCSMTNCDAKSVKVTHSSNVTGTTYMGGLVGQANTDLNVINNNSVSGQDGVNDGKGFDVSVSGNTVNFYAGGLLGYTIGDAHEVKNNTVEKVYITNTGTINGGRLGGFIGYVESNGTTGKILVKGNTATTVNITVGGNTAGTPYLGGFIGQAKGKASPSNRSTIEGNTVTSPTVTMNGVVGHGFYMGGFLGYADTNTNLYNNKVASPAISITNEINAETYVGGAVGRQNGYTTIDGMTVTDGSITGPSAAKTVKNNTNFFVGGFIGQQNSSGTAAYQTNKFMNVAVSNMTINLGHYVPGGVINNHKFAVGGIAGCVHTPNKDVNGFVGMPENIIFKGGKIYAPYAATSPTVANFNASVAAQNNYTGDNVTTLDALDLRKTKTWYYTDYKLGLSDAIVSGTNIQNWGTAVAKDKFRRNYTATPTTDSSGDGVKYITVNSSTFKRQNRYMDNERQSWTVLWWTNQGSHSATGGAAQLFTEEEQPIYPQSGFSTVGTAELTKFPWYMYFYQGVANATYVSGTNATAIIAGIEANFTQSAQDHPVKLTVTNENEKKRGFDARTITVSATNNEADVTSSYTYKWYVDGVAKSETGSSITLTPHWKYAQGVTVIAMNGEEKVATASYTLPVGVLKTKNGDENLVGMPINDRGTKANPYLIDCDHALRQLSFLSTLGTGYRWEGLVMPTATQNTNGVANQSQGHYNRAYYELANDITMTSETFVPISHMGYNSNANDGTYTYNFIFQGNFDGKGHKISGLNIIWGAGQYNGNDANVYHGLFGAVGHSVATAKWGDGAATSNTVIQNLVIENATLKHDPANTTFSYKKSYSHITGDNYNNCMVGVLAGVVAANTTIQNIEIRGSEITDEGTANDYSLATKGLFVGGAIGSVQAQYNNTNIPTNTVIKNIVVGTNITLTKAKIQDVAIAQQGAYNVGGVIGRFASTNGNLSATQAVMPKYLLYTGSIKAYHSGDEGRKDAMISPVIAATRYSTNQSINLTNISKIWEGNNNAAEQLTVADALYYDFKISDASGNMHLVTEDYPDKVCPNGARTQDTHTDGNETAGGYNAQRYQGVNYNAVFCDAETYGGDADGGKRMAVAILNSHNDVTIYWEWSSKDATPHMTETRTEGAYIVADAETADRYNVVGTAAAPGRYYKWYVDGVLQNDEHSSSFNKTADIGDIYIKAEVYENSSDASPIATTQYLVVKGEFKVNTSIKKEGDTYTVGIDRGGDDLTENTLGGRIAVAYQWYKGNAVNVNTAELLSGETAKSITITKDQLGEVNNIFCHVTITATADSKVLFTGDISQYVRDANVVYLQLADVKASNGTTYSYSNAGTNTGTNDSYGVKQADYANATYGRTPDKPVKSWAEAYALLNPYTEPTQEYVTGHGGTWTSATEYNDEVYYLANKDTYLYDVYKREGFKRKVKPIEECTNSWDNNIIVLMGLSKDGYFNNSETSLHNVDGRIANKPVTITGQWDGTNYYGYLSNLSGDFSINADHKFENMGLGVLDKGIGATESIRYRIYAHRWNVHAGKGLLMGWAAALEWGPSVVPVTDENKKAYKITSADVSTGTPVGQYACDIAIMGGYLNDNTSTNPEMFEYINHGRDDIGQQIKIESGFWGPVCPGNRQTDSGNTITTYYTMGGPDHPAKTTITVDIDRKWNDGTNRNYYNSAMSPATVDVGCMLTGNHEGTMYADVTLNILSGRMGRMVNGIKGAQRRQIKNPGSFTTDGHYRHTVKYGEDWTEIAAPAPDSYFGRGIMKFDPSLSVNNTSTDPEVGINKRVSVVELYCGGLGRSHNDGSYHPEVRSYFYGLCEVSIKGGTFYKTIYGSGAGGTNGIGTAEHHTDDDGIPYWNTKLDPGKTRVWYAPYDYIKKTGAGSEREGDVYDFVKVKVAEDNSEDANLTADGYVDLEKTRNIINITGGVFGSEDKPVSIYAGGNGETDAALINPSATKVGDVKNTYNTPNHQAGNMYGTADGLTTQINISGDAKIYGSIFGGGKGSMRYYRYFLRAPDNIVAYTADNQEYSRIWNPFKSANGDYNKANGTDWQNIINSRKNADRYLNLGQIYGNTKVTISGDVEILGNVYGGGEGVSDITVEELFRAADSELGLADQSGQKSTIIAYTGTAVDAEGNPTNKRSAHVDWEHDKFVNFPDMGKIFGNAGVDISGNVTIHGNVYGGGKAGAIDGMTTVEVKGNVNIFGEVFGAGQGLLVDAAKDYTKIATIKGDATVELSENATIWQDMFGGGQNAIVDGSTYFNMIGGHVAANVFGGGKGDIKKNSDGEYVYEDNAPIVTSADISGNTSVSITGGDVIWDRTSMSTATSSSITIHTYSKTTLGKTHTNETFTTSDSQATQESVKSDFENEGNTSVTVSAGPTERTEGTGDDEHTVYDFTVTYTTPSTTDSWSGTEAEFNALPAARKTELQDPGYTHTTKIETSGLAKGEIVWWNPYNPSLADGTVEDGNKYYNSLFYDEANRIFKIEHNIFGGGYIACNVGDTAKVTMTKGLGDNRLTATSQWKYSFNDYAHPHFYCFGGGYGAYTTVANTVVDVNVTNFDSSLSADTDEQLARPRKAIISGDPIDENPIAIGVYNNQYGIAQATVLGVLGGSYAGFVKNNTNVTIGGKTFISRVYGGGFGQLEAYNELTELRSGNLMKAADDAFLATKTREFLGEVGGNTLVNIKGGNIYGNVYGGGAGVESAKVVDEKYVALADNEVNTAEKDFVMGRVMGKTDVNIYSNANVFGNVYGGGDIANVLGEGNEVDRTRIVTNADLDDDFATNLNIKGGKVYGNVFGGGSGRPANKVASYNSATDNFNSIRVGMVGKDLTDYPEGDLVNLQGHTRVHIYNGIATQEDVDLGVASDVGVPVWPYVYGDIYGGCAYGVVTGTSEVLIDGGRIGNDIFGGGLGDIEQLKDAQGQFTGYGKVTSANVLGNSIVTINGGYALWNEMSDDKGNVKVWPRENYISKNTEITDANEFFYNAATKRFVKDHNVYGGGNVACVVGRYVVDRYDDKGNKETANDAFSSSDKPVKRFPVLFKEGEFKCGNTVVMMNESHFSDPELFMNYAKWNDEPEWSLAAKCWQATMEEQREPQFSVFGAGKGLLTKTIHNAQSRVEVLAVKYDIDGKLIMNGSRPEEHWTVGWDEDYEYMLQWNEEDNAGGTEKAKLANFYPDRDWMRPNYVDAERRLRTAAFAKQIGVAGNTVMQIVGGGYDGCVEGNTLASGESRAIIGKMYGGGYGSYDGWKLAMDLDAANAEHNYPNFVGTVGGQAVLNIDRGCLVRGDVFAGGAGVESLKLDGNNKIIPETSAAYKSANYHDFDQVARVNNTHLKFGLIGASEAYNFVVPVVYGSVYGGGDVANVTGIAKSEVVRGQAMQYFFGGGNGRLASKCRDYRTLGGVGATDVHFDMVRKGDSTPYEYEKNYGTIAKKYTLEPIVWDRVYAGGRNGLVRGGYLKAGGDAVEPGNTHLVIDGGQFGYNIFGGGEGTLDTDADGNYLYDADGKQIMTSADILGNTEVVVNGGDQNIDQIWNPVKYEWTLSNYDDAGTPYSPQYDWRLTQFNISHNIYAGGRIACVVGTMTNDIAGKKPGEDGYSMTPAANTGNTSLTMNKGMLDHQYFESFGTPFLESWEWRDIYTKHASPFFCVFGGGYGKNAIVLGDTYVDVKFDKDDTEAVTPSNEAKVAHHHNQASIDNCTDNGVVHDHQTQFYTKFPDGQSLMDIIGGGYSGDVMGTCHVSVDGNTYVRNIFGGGYYANAGATMINVNQGNIDNIYGGGMMGNVLNTVAVNVGQEPHAADPENGIEALNADDAAAANKEVVILGNVYGANDVAGLVGATETENGEIRPTYQMDGDGNVTEVTTDGATITLRGGHIHGNVYGGGNGDYLYMVDQNVNVVTAEEQFEIDKGIKKLVYRVPIRKLDFPSLSSMSDAQKIVNIATYRPAIMKTKIDFKGNGTQVTIGEEPFVDLLRVDGNIFGGGSSATVSNFTDKAADSFVKLNVGSYIRVGGVYLGSDGDALFETSGSNNFIEDFPKLNNITLAKTVDWVNEPTNSSIPLKYLAVPKEERPNVYKNVLDLYFMPVEMNFMPEVTWNGKNSSIEVAADPNQYEDVPDTPVGITDAEIGTFCCGGNRGNMNTTTNFHVNFPEGLTITGNIIGGCNNSNDTKTDANGTVMSHTGGFLLGTHKVETGSVKRTPQIHLTMRNKFRPTMLDESGEVTTDASKLYMYREGNNVYGGCYHSGTVRGDVLIDMRSNMINGIDSVALERGGDSRAVCNVYGAGYGSGTWVYGDTQVLLGKGVDWSPVPGKKGRYNIKGASANYVYGGGQRGNVVGTTTVRILNGRVAGCVVGASYASNLYGSAQTIVGYPDTYYICNTTGRYNLNRVDQNHSDLLGDDGKPVVKRQIWHTKGDIVSEATYTELKESDKQYFDEFNLTGSNRAEQPADWSNVNIQIDQAIYGGGYALPDGSGSYTVRKYTADYNLNNYAESVYDMPAGITLDNDGTGGAYGGNTFVMIGDRIAPDNADDRDHITISSSQLEELHPGADDELFGKYYRSDDGIVFINYPTTINLNSKFDNNTQFYNFTGRGGLYGDGRLSLSEGYRVSDIRGYGYNGSKPSDAKLLNCLHRFDASRFTDCCVSILGDLDYTTNESGGSGAVKYAIARIGELQMISSINDANALSVDVTNGATVTQMGKRTRNYLGFSNTVRDLGAVWSNVPFDGTYSKHHDENGALTSKTYKVYKNEIIDANYDNQNAELKKRTDGVNASAKFQERNNGTAKNMIGIASGYALRVENSFAEKMPASRDASPDPQDGTNTFYYGPVYGVFEVKLVNTRPGEAGGYVYAQNIHQEYITDAESHTVHDFMESTGNFVFPMSDTRKVVDDCYPYAYTKSERDNVDAIESKDGHYWYVTGMNYFYYGTITGYTYDSQTSPLYFNMNSKELRISLTGAKRGQDVTLKEFRMLKTHSSAFAKNCDIENKFYTNRNTETNKDYYDVGWVSPNANSYYKLSLSATESGLYQESEISDDDKKKNVPYIEELAEYTAPVVPNSSEPVGKQLDGTLQHDNPYLAIRLTDKVDNNSKVDDGNGGQMSYLKKYLDEACQAIIVLTSPAVDDNGNRIYDAYEESNDGLETMKTNVAKGITYYILDGNGDYRSLTAAEVNDFNESERPSAVFVVAPDRYIPLGDGAFDPNATYYVIDNVNGTLAADDKKYSKVESPVEAEKATYYTKQAGGSPKTFEYTINLTIKYIQGPDYEGKATVQNCALPGEMIRLSSSTVTIISDVINMPQNGSLWTVGPGKKRYADDGTYTWVLDESDPSKVFKYNPKDDVTSPKVIASRGVLSKAYYEEDSKDLYIPAYYFMNGYVARYSYSVKGIYDDGDKTQPTMFHVTVAPEDTLWIHNYHRMNPMLGTERIPVETYIRKAAVRYASDVERLTADNAHDEDPEKSGEPRQTNMALTYISCPRVYIEDVDDLKKFAEYVNEDGNDNGRNLEFFLMTDLTVPHDWTAITNFEGTFHGTGHVLKGLGDKSLFAANEGHIHNLGLETGKITQTETPSLYHCCYTKANNTVYRMGETVKTDYTDDDWLYGNVAYDLNQYYLEERYDRNTDQQEDDAVKDTHDHDGYVEKIYGNGDYQYARTYNGGGEGYLRNNTNPHYIISDFDAVVTNPENITYHNTDHDVDEARAYYNDDDTFNEYRPLFEEAKHNTTATPSTTKNDYLFFGQYLNKTINRQTLPSVLIHTQRGVETMYNRVYRAYGYYRSGDDDLYHFNRDAYVLNPTITAIDFNGWHDESREWKLQDEGDIFYQKVIDRPASLLGTEITIDDAVTRNLLIYNQVPRYSQIKNYQEDAPETDIRYHAIGIDEDNSVAADPKGIEYFHLVERDGRDLVANNDFFAPIAFDVTQRAWYERRPAGYRNPVGQGKPTYMWEGITLPFTAKNVTAFVNNPETDEIANGEISHFYGNSVTHHEYWLHGLTGVDGEGATFSRLGISSPASDGESLFTHSEQERESADYRYVNHYFAQLYDYDSSEKYGEWYKHADDDDGANVHNGYVYLTHDIPYIIAFPGNDYYEFSMEGSKIYDVRTYHEQIEVGSHEKTGSPQYARFEATPQDAAHPVKIGVSSNDYMKTVVSSSVHQGTYLALNTTSHSNAPAGIVNPEVMGINNVNGDGGSFDEDVQIVLPFRTYMSASTTPAHRRILILEHHSGDEDEDMQPEDDMLSGRSVAIEVRGRNVIVKSTFDDVRMINVYRVSGQLVTVHEAPAGESAFTLPGEGVYIINGKKVIVRNM